MREDIDIAAHGWVRRGLVWHNPALKHHDEQASKPVATIPRRRTRARKVRTCRDCPAKISARNVRCRDCYTAQCVAMKATRRPSSTDGVDDLMATLERTFAASPRADQWAGCCEHCDCLLAYPDETCPGCLAWAELNACATSWKAARIAYKPAADQPRKVAA